MMKMYFFSRYSNNKYCSAVFYIHKIHNTKSSVGHLAIFGQLPVFHITHDETGKKTVVLLNNYFLITIVRTTISKHTS